MMRREPFCLRNIVMAFGNVYRSKTVWVSGTTGFKGAYLAQWLCDLGARVVGFGLKPPTQPSVFEQIGLASRIEQTIADLNDAAAVRASIDKAQPDFIFHLAAQPLVRLSYDEPTLTFATNVMGTINVLEAARELKKPCALVCATTDKVYENREWIYGYREVDPLGGYDPYSASKAAAEIAIACWRRSFFQKHPVRVASARAGNVIGGGDWALDRIVPDCVRALRDGKPIAVRNKVATRPWQHVLEPLSGYLWLAAALSKPDLVEFGAQHFDSAFNFGPELEANRTVKDLVEEVLKHWPGRWEDKSDPAAVHEAKLLNLACDKAHHLLGWKPVWNFAEAVAQTMQWYGKAEGNASGEVKGLAEFTSKQIDKYAADAGRAGVAWARK
jgi:CDP-glucose 4,6-dehydratase